MDELLMASATKKLLSAYLHKPTHALILQGPVGVGLGTIAHELAVDLAGRDSRVITIESEKGLISIERIRQLYQQTRTIHHDPLVIVIDDADTMSQDAQNALLKLFEEPVANVHFLLTVHHPEFLLATLSSRAHIVAVQPVSSQDCAQLLARRQLPETTRRQLLFLANGLPAELYRLVDDEAYFESRATLVKDARTLLQSPLYQRLLLLKKYSSRDDALALVVMCGRLLHHSILTQKKCQLSTVVESVLETEEALRVNGHVRTHLMHLMTKLDG